MSCHWRRPLWYNSLKSLDEWWTNTRRRWRSTDPSLQLPRIASLPPSPPPLPLFLSSFPNDAIDANDAIEIIRVITKRKKQVPAIRRSYPFFLFWTSPSFACPIKDQSNLLYRKEQVWKWTTLLSAKQTKNTNKKKKMNIVRVFCFLSKTMKKSSSFPPPSPPTLPPPQKGEKMTTTMMMMIMMITIILNLFLYFSLLVCCWFLFAHFIVKDQTDTKIEW